MDNSQILIFVVPAAIWFILVYCWKPIVAKVGSSMSKILSVISKSSKKITTAADDFFSNFNRGSDSTPPKKPVIIQPKPEVLPPKVEDIIPGVQIEIPVQETPNTELPIVEEPVEQNPPIINSTDILLNILITKVAEIPPHIQNIQERIQNMSLNLEALTAEVARAKTVQASAVDLIKKVASELEKISEDLHACHDNHDDLSALDSLTADLKSSTDALSAAVADSYDVLPSHTIILNADNPEVPTVEVTVPEVIPEVVTAVVDQIVDEVDTTSTEPQIQIVIEESEPEIVEAVEEASDEVVADPEQNIVTADGEEVVTGVVETDEGEVDVVVVTPLEDASVAGEAGLVVADVIKEAYEATPPEVVAEPEVISTDFATTPETGGAASEGLEGTQSGPAAESNDEAVEE